MRFEPPSTDGEDVESPYGDPNHGDDASRDERHLYGEPNHEVHERSDEQVLYGEPQHEPDGPRLPDVELLFARLRTESATGPTVLPARSETSEKGTSTER